MFEPLFSAISPLWAVTNTVARRFLRNKAHRLPKPVISVGNIVAGGVGKTEVVAALAQRLIANGKKVVVAMRYADESLVLLQKVPELKVAVGGDRYSVLMKNWTDYNPDIVILDDGYQHFALERDLDILVHDFSVSSPIYRDFPSQFYQVPVRIAFSEVPSAWQKLSWVQARYKIENITDAQGRAQPLPKEVVAFCGLGNPKRFQNSLNDAGVTVKGFHSFPDHMNYSRQNIQELMNWKRKYGDLPLLTSLKDYVKLHPFMDVPGFKPFCVNISLRFLENESILWKATDAL